MSKETAVQGRIYLKKGNYITLAAYFGSIAGT